MQFRTYNNVPILRTKNWEGVLSIVSLDNLFSFSPGIVLQKGDNDAKLIWGGKKYPNASGTPIVDLQKALASLNVFNFGADGDFGPRTQEAVERFQWYVTRFAHRLRIPLGAEPASGSIVSFVQPTGILVDGRVSQQTLKEVQAWIAGRFVATSPLIRYDVGSLQNMSLNSGFVPLSYPSAKPNEMLVHEGFLTALGTLDQEAGSAKVKLRINQAFRVQNVPPSGAVVPPASRSQHLIGHAVDVNIVDGSTINTSAMFKAGKQTKAADTFIAAVKKLGIRWGGNFSDVDPPHFDDNVAPNGREYKHSFYLAQRSYNQSHPIRTSV